MTEQDVPPITLVEPPPRPPTIREAIQNTLTAANSQIQMITKRDGAVSHEEIASRCVVSSAMSLIALTQAVVELTDTLRLIGQADAAGIERIAAAGCGGDDKGGLCCGG